MLQLNLRRPAATAGVYLLADHLDAALAAAEDLSRIELPADRVALDREVARARGLEVRLALRVLEAQRQARRPLPSPARQVADLFVGSTRVLEDAVNDLSDWTRSDFETGGDAITFLRSRGLITADAGGPPPLPRPVGEGFLLARRIELGLLMDLLARFLDTLDTIFELYPPPPAPDEPAPVAEAAIPAEAAAAEDAGGLRSAASADATAPAEPPSEPPGAQPAAPATPAPEKPDAP